jgi:hypothetical protein
LVRAIHALLGGPASTALSRRRPTGRTARLVVAKETSFALLSVLMISESLEEVAAEIMPVLTA